MKTSVVMGLPPPVGTPALAQPCGIRARHAAQATVRAFGRTRLGRPSFPTDSKHQRSNGLSQSLTLSSAHAEDTLKIQGARSGLASGAATGGGGPAGLPRPVYGTGANSRPARGRGRTSFCATLASD